jgi:hypothetical protein
MIDQVMAGHLFAPPRNSDYLGEEDQSIIVASNGERHYLT